MNRKLFRVLPLLAVLLLCLRSAAQDNSGGNQATSAQSGYVTIRNDFYEVDQNGQRVATRSGCLRQFNGLYYWYGGTNRFLDHTCYVSSDLVHWTYKGVVLHTDVDANRLDVLYNEPTKTYVMFLKFNGNGAHFAIATAQQPAGPFTFKSQTLVDDALIGDMTVFQDDDGKAYLCYVSWKTGVNRQHGIYLMSPDYLTLDKRIYLWNIAGREAPHIFKRNGIYYYGTSKTAGILSSDTNYCTATNLAGPWSEPKTLSTLGSSNSWDSQVNFIFPFKGPQGTVYMFEGDRWLKNGGRQGDFVWLPLEFDGDTPILRYRQDWELNAAAGTWRDFDDSRDLAHGKTATASSTSGDNAPNHVTAGTNYLNYPDIRWESQASDPQWITVDLGALTPFNRVILKWGNTAASVFKIQVSTDNANWTDIYSSVKGSAFSVTDVSFNTTTAHYVRMSGSERIVQRIFPGRGQGFRRATTRPTTQFSAQPTTRPATPGGYKVLKD